MAELWDIEEGITYPERFFQLVPELLPHATHFFVEGSSVAPIVEALYARFGDPGPYLPRKQTIWPRRKVFRCVADRALFEELADLSAHHAAPEVLDHLSIYAGDRMLIDWHDAFANALLLIRIEDFSVLRGSLPPRALGLVMEWAGLRQKELSEVWRQAEAQQTLSKIPPLE